MHVCAIASARATIGGPNALSRTSANATAFQSLTIVAPVGVENSPMAARVIAMIFGLILRLCVSLWGLWGTAHTVTYRPARSRGRATHRAGTRSSKCVELGRHEISSDDHSPPMPPGGDRERHGWALEASSSDPPRHSQRQRPSYERCARPPVR